MKCWKEKKNNKTPNIQIQILAILCLSLQRERAIRSLGSCLYFCYKKIMLTYIEPNGLTSVSMWKKRGDPCWELEAMWNSKVCIEI